jgi:hypothetical protein
MFDLSNVKKDALWVAAGIAFMFAVLFGLMLILSSCHNLPPVVLPTNDSPQAVCQNLARLQCPEAQPTRTGKSCVEVVSRTNEVRGLPMACLSYAATIDDLRACPDGAVRCVW